MQRESLCPGGYGFLGNLLIILVFFFSGTDEEVHFIPVASERIVSPMIGAGEPSFSPRFGFTPARAKGLEAPSPVPDKAFMVREFSPGSIGSRTGVVCYPPAFLAGIEYIPPGTGHAGRVGETGMNKGGKREERSIPPWQRLGSSASLTSP